MRFIRVEAYRPDRSFVGKPVISPIGRLWITQVAAVLGVVWVLTVTLRALWLGLVDLNAGAVMLWWGRLLAVGILVVPASCLVHELMHHLAAPGGIRSQHNVMLLKWGWLPVAAAHEAWVTRNRQLTIQLAPLVGMTGLSLIAGSLVEPTHRLYVALFWELNLILCATDLVVAYRILRVEPTEQMCGAGVQEPGTGSTA